MLYSVVPIPTRLVNDVWKETRPLVEKGLERDDRYQAEDIYVALIKKQKQLWLIQQKQQTIAVVITEITVYPRVKECTVFLVSGKDVEKWLPYTFTVIAQWAREVGCKRGRMYGRIGFDKVLSNEWKRQQVVMTVELQEISHEWQREWYGYSNNNTN